MRNFTYDPIGEHFPATEAEIAEFQTLVNVELPAYFVEFHQIHGYCCVEEQFYPDETLKYFLPLVQSENDEFSCSSEFVLVKQLLSDTVEEKEAYDELVHEYLKCTWIPFAQDPFGNWFCIKLTGENIGSVHLLLPEFSSDDNPFKFLTTSFEEFLNTLSIDPDVAA